MPLKNSEKVRGERRPEAQDSQEQGTVVGGRGRRYRMGRLGIRDLKTIVGQECSISRGGARLYSGGIHAGGVTEGAAPRVRAAKSSEFGEGKL